MLAMLNYAIDAQVLSALVPTGTELDVFEGRTYVSLIGFRFLHTRVRAIWIPFHSDFDEVNLRFYVRRTVAGEVRRGVAFVREIVPRYAIAKVAQLVYGERYLALPMRHRVSGPTSEGGRVRAEYGWRSGGQWNTLRMEAEGRPAPASPGSLQQFITEHYWGYALQRDGRAVEYQVTHEPWRVWTATSASFDGDCTSIYGAELAAVLRRPPDSAFLAEGSAVAVMPGRSD
uniref:DUF2071 domain-containing protein n=1 Tax=Solibacter usitatus (strain Ellin6076) TaxID=234267 RepID=Q01YD5_SOLUE